MSFLLTPRSNWGLFNWGVTGGVTTWEAALSLLSLISELHKTFTTSLLSQQLRLLQFVVTFCAHDLFLNQYLCWLSNGSVCCRPVTSHCVIQSFLCWFGLDPLFATLELLFSLLLKLNIITDSLEPIVLKYFSSWCLVVNLSPLGLIEKPASVWSLIYRSRRVPRVWRARQRREPRTSWPISSRGHWPAKWRILIKYPSPCF